MNIFNLLNPDNQYRSAPFWSWNGKMQSNILAEHIENMNLSGIGGFYMHSRSGLKTDFMGQEWLKCIESSIEKAEKLNMKACFYDEDRYSSGFGGGLVAADNINFASKILVMRKKCQLGENETRVASFHITFENTNLVDFQADKNGEFVFDIILDDKSPWTNYGYSVDMCYEGATEKFIELCYEPYYKKFSKYFGNTIPYMFTDEIKIAWLEHKSSWNAGIIAATYWTYDYANKFFQINGYKIEDHLPELFYRYRNKPYSKVSNDHVKTMTELFRTNFTKKLGDWCSQRKIELTGHLHLSGFDSVFLCGMPMQQLYHFGMPGVDTLTDSVHKFSAIKQAVSVSNQFNKNRTLCEIYGCTGWDWPLYKHKFHGDWQYSLGINYRCQHLTHYTVTGFGKRDYPASISHHSPWWKYYNKIEDYFARLSYVLSQGKSCNDVLVICPQENLMGYYEGIHLEGTPKNTERIYSLCDEWETLTKKLIDDHVLFDFGDEDLMRKYGKALKGELQIGEMKYKTVIIFPNIEIKDDTLELIKKSDVKIVRENFSELSEIKINKNNKISTDAWCNLREVDDGYILFIAPNKPDVEGSFNIKTNLNKRFVYRINCDNGSIVEAKPDFILNKGESALFYFTDEIIDCGIERNTENVNQKGILQNSFEYYLGEKNVLPLDFCRYKIGENEFSENLPVCEVENQILSYYNLPSKRFYDSAQPWALYNTGLINTSPKDNITLMFDFAVSVIPKICRIAYEYDSRIIVKVNGMAVTDFNEKYIDDFILSADIQGLIKLGKNVIELDFAYCADMELENIYLVGDFGVGLMNQAKGNVFDNYEIIALPKNLNYGKIISQGLDFYTGSVYCHLSLDKSVKQIEIKDPNCTCVALHIDGKTIVKAWGKYFFDLSDYKDISKAKLEFVFGRKNIFGPLHAEVANLVEPHYFDYKNIKWKDEYILNLNSIGEIIFYKA